MNAHNDDVTKKVIPIAPDPEAGSGGLQRKPRQTIKMNSRQLCRQRLQQSAIGIDSTRRRRHTIHRKPAGLHPGRRQRRTAVQPPRHGFGPDPGAVDAGQTSRSCGIDLEPDFTAKFTKHTYAIPYPRAMHQTAIGNQHKIGGR